MPTLVVDLDGTLTPSDSLWEALLSAVKRSPKCIPAILAALLEGRAAFKVAVVKSPGALPLHLAWRQDVLDYLHEQRSAGRRIVLATAAHQLIAEQVASELGLFDAVLSTHQDVNLKGRHKLAAIVATEGVNFVYMGDSRADLPVWEGARAAVLVAVKPAVRAVIKVPVEREFAAPRAGASDLAPGFRTP